MHDSYKPLSVSLFWLAPPSTSTWISSLHAPSTELKEVITSHFAYLEKLSLNFKGSWFVICVNLLHP